MENIKAKHAGVWGWGYTYMYRAVWTIPGSCVLSWRYVAFARYLYMIMNKELKEIVSNEMFDFLTLTMSHFLNGIIHHTFLELSIIILGISRWELEVGQPTVLSLVRLHGCLALYWWQRLITFGSDRIMVNITWQQHKPL